MLDEDREKKKNPLPRPFPDTAGDFLPPSGLSERIVELGGDAGVAAVGGDPVPFPLDRLRVLTFLVDVEDDDVGLGAGRVLFGVDVRDDAAVYAYADFMG